FCFYHYWFSGKRLLEKPVDLLIANPHIDLPFMLCWANENWTRTWDGSSYNVLAEQNYSQKDSVRFIDDVAKYLQDPRYIRIDGKPVLLVYKPNIIPDFARVVSAWRRHWRKLSGGELLIWTNRTNHHDQACRGLEGVADAIVEFPPHVVNYEFDQSALGFETNGHFFDYALFADDVIRGSEQTDTPSLDFYRAAMLGWDNSPRRTADWSVWYGFSLKKYYE